MPVIPRSAGGEGSPGPFGFVLLGNKRGRMIAYDRAIPHNSARADPEKIWVLIKALFRRCTLCTSRKSDEIRAQIFQEMPKADCAVLP